MNGKAFFLGVSLRMILEVEPVEKVKKIHSHQCVQVSSNLLRTQREKNDGRGDFLLTSDARALSFGVFIYKILKPLPHILSPLSCPLCSLTTSLWFFLVVLIHTITFSGSPAYPWHVVELLVLHHCMNQFQKYQSPSLPLFLPLPLYTHTHTLLCVDSVTLENSD